MQSTENCGIPTLLHRDLEDHNLTLIMGQGETLGFDKNKNVFFPDLMVLFKIFVIFDEVIYLANTVAIFSQNVVIQCSLGLNYISKYCHMSSQKFFDWKYFHLTIEMVFLTCHLCFTCEFSPHLGFQITLRIPFLLLKFQLIQM